MTPSNRAVVAHAADDLRIESRPEPRPAAEEAVIAVAFGGVCGSDLHYWRHGAAGESILRAPMVLGHEVVGVVRHAAADGSGPAVGTAVAVHPATELPGDGSRYPADRPNLAPGGTYLGSAARVPHTEGAFADRVALPSRMLRPLPQGLSLRAAAVVEPASVAWHAVARAGEVVGRHALVVGAGPIGALIVAVLRRAGAARVTVVDLVPRALDAGLALGADAALLADDDAAAVAAVDADVSFESSGNHRGLASAVRGTTRGGTVVMVGLLPSGEQPALISLAITRELELRGSFRFAGEIEAVVAALADGSLDVAGVVTHDFDADDALEAFAVAADPARSGKVLLRFAGAGQL